MVDQVCWMPVHPLILENGKTRESKGGDAAGNRSLNTYYGKFLLTGLLTAFLCCLVMVIGNDFHQLIVRSLVIKK
jgi:hypothetical protein